MYCQYSFLFCIPIMFVCRPRQENPNLATQLSQSLLDSSVVGVHPVGIINRSCSPVRGLPARLTNAIRLTVENGLFSLDFVPSASFVPNASAWRPRRPIRAAMWTTGTQASGMTHSPPSCLPLPLSLPPPSSALAVRSLVQESTYMSLPSFSWICPSRFLRSSPLDLVDLFVPPSFLVSRYRPLYLSATAPRSLRLLKAARGQSAFRSIHGAPKPGSETTSTISRDICSGCTRRRHVA